MQKILDLESRFSLNKPDHFLLETLKSSYNESERKFIKEPKQKVMNKKTLGDFK